MPLSSVGAPAKRRARLYTGAAAAPLKPLVTGVGPRNYSSYGAGTVGKREHCGFIVAMTDWRDWQPTAFGPIATSGRHITELNNALAAVHAGGVHDGEPMQVRLRIMGGPVQPSAVKTLAGPFPPGDNRNKLIFCDPSPHDANWTSGRDGTPAGVKYAQDNYDMARWWLTASPFDGSVVNTAFGAADDFLTKLAAFSHSSWGGETVESHPQILEITYHPQSTLYSEPYQRGVSTSYKIDNTNHSQTVHASGAQTLPRATVTVDSTAGLDSLGSISTPNGTISYDGITATTLTNCTGGSGTLANGAAMTQTINNDMGTGGFFDGMTNIEAYYAAGLLGCPGGNKSAGPDPQEIVAQMWLFQNVNGIPRWKSYFPTTRLYEPHNPLQHWLRRVTDGAIIIAQDPNGWTGQSIIWQAVGGGGYLGLGKQFIQGNNSWQVPFGTLAYRQMYENMMAQSLCALSFQTATLDTMYATASGASNPGDPAIAPPDTHAKRILVVDHAIKAATGIYYDVQTPPDSTNDPFGWIDPPNYRFRSCSIELPTGIDWAFLTAAMFDGWNAQCEANAAAYE
jgi:hypothetical protein